MINDKIPVVYKKGSVVPMDKDAESYANYVFNDLNDIKSNYIKLGFHLDEIYRLEKYKPLGYDDFYEYCLCNFNLDKSAVSRSIGVFKRFSSCTDYGVHQMFIDEKYKNYSYSQLCEMLSCRDDDIKKIKPDMTIKQIRELKKNNFQAINKGVATSQQDVKYYTLDSLLSDLFSFVRSKLNKNNIIHNLYRDPDKIILIFHVLNSPGKNYIPEGSYTIKIIKNKEDKGV